MFAPTDLNRTLAACVEALEVKFKEKALTVTETLDSAVPVFSADAGKLEQAFYNLFFNAVDASDQGGHIEAISRFHDHDKRPYVEVVVKDEGHGIEPRFMDEIFKPFFSTRTKGTGLGLSNAKRIVHAHGGWIKAENRRSKGATFRVNLTTGGDHGQNTDH